MIDAIVYCSLCGHTKTYALKLAQELQVPAFSLKQAKKLKKETTIFYLGWVCENKIMGYDKAMRFHIDAVAAVGISPYDAEMVANLREYNQLPVGLFYLRGGIHKRKLPFRKRWVLRSIEKNLEFEKKDSGLTRKKEELLQALQQQINAVSLDSLEPIIKHYQLDIPHFVS